MAEHQGSHNHPDSDPALNSHEGYHEDGHSDEHHSGGSYKHKGGHDHGGHGGGHGGSWLVTYCDMITLLIAFFICILTFSSQENGKGASRRMHDSVVYGPGGLGIAGTAAKAGEPDQLVWRQVLASTDVRRQGSMMAPLHSDPSWDYTSPVLTMVDTSSDTNLGDRYSSLVPTSLLFADGDKVSSSGKQLMHFYANNLSKLPYEINIEARDPQSLPKALILAQFLIRECKLDPARVGIGTADPTAKRGDVFRFVMLERSK